VGELLVVTSKEAEIFTPVTTGLWDCPFRGRGAYGAEKGRLRRRDDRCDCEPILLAVTTRPQLEQPVAGGSSAEVGWCCAVRLEWQVSGSVLRRPSLRGLPAGAGHRGW
jgi:hypothetical protein